MLVYRRNDDEKNSEKMEEECIEAHQPYTYNRNCRYSHPNLLYCTLAACTLGQLYLVFLNKKVAMKDKNPPLGTEFLCT